MKTHTLLPLFTSAVVSLSGCATTAPQDLINARTAYDRASHGPSAELAAADLHTAKTTLDSAELSFKDEGDSQETRDLAYTAGRRAEVAETHARTMQATQLKDQSKEQLQVNATSKARSNAVELGQAKSLLASQGQQLVTERQRREDAEKRAAQAASDLSKFATVKQEPRGMVITLSGSVLFASGKADLLPAAQLKLNEVADALTKEDPDSAMVVEGYTDSQGAAAYNQDLSQRRAQAVRDYLVSRHISSDRVTAQGFGPTKAIADNASPEGRANNRRVEIVVKPKN